MEHPVPSTTALVVVDAQRAFDHPTWGPRDNPDADHNMARLIDAFHRTGRPVVVVRHASTNPDSPLHPDHEGHQYRDYVDPARAAVEVVKSVNSSFHGAPDLDAWLRGHDIGTVVVTGITTNHCCETTARVGGNLGYDVRFVLDATFTFDRTGPDGITIAAVDLAAVTATNLHEEFATVTFTAAVLEQLSAAPLR